MRILLVTTGSSGDINPFIALGRALAARGHEARILTNPHFYRQIEEAGVGTVEAGEGKDFGELIRERPDLMHPTKGPIVVLRDFMIPMFEDYLNYMRAEIERWSPDAVVAHHIMPVAGWECERIGMRWATVALSPIGWNSANDPICYGRGIMSDVPRWARPSQRWMQRQVVRLMLDRPFAKAKRELGFKAPGRSMFEDMRAGDLSLGLWSPVLRGPVEGDPEGARICGFTWHDRRAESEHNPADIEAFLNESDEAPIVFTLGTAAVHVAGRFYHHAAAACRMLGRRGLLLTGRAEYAPKKYELPVGVRAFTYAPFSTLLPRAAATVHHGGVGTTAQALRAGRPTIVVPHSHDQFDNAARCRRLGCSATVVSTRSSASGLAAALRAALDSPEPSRIAGEVAGWLKGEDGAVVATGFLEGMVG